MKEKILGMIECCVIILKMLVYSYFLLKIGWKYKCFCLFVISIVLFCNFCKSMLKYVILICILCMYKDVLMYIKIMCMLCLNSN